MERQQLTSLSVTFLGTASAQPSSTRNHSALALRLNSDVWLFDCGEATQHQLQKSTLKMGKIEKIFITHTHGEHSRRLEQVIELLIQILLSLTGDHIFGLIPLLASCMNGAGGVAGENAEDPRRNLETTIPVCWS